LSNLGKFNCARFGMSVEGRGRQCSAASDPRDNLAGTATVRAGFPVHFAGTPTLRADVFTGTRCSRRSLVAGLQWLFRFWRHFEFLTRWPLRRFSGVTTNSVWQPRCLA
jgi:hypothetical protein